MYIYIYMYIYVCIYIYICKSILHHPFFMFKSIYIYRVLIKYYIIYFVLHNPPRSITTGRPLPRGNVDGNVEGRLLTASSSLSGGVGITLLRGGRSM